MDYFLTDVLFQAPRILELPSAKIERAIVRAGVGYEGGDFRNSVRGLLNLRSPPELK